MYRSDEDVVHVHAETKTETKVPKLCLRCGVSPRTVPHGGLCFHCCHIYHGKLVDGLDGLVREYFAGTKIEFHGDKKTGFREVEIDLWVPLTPRTFTKCNWCRVELSDPEVARLGAVAYDREVARWKMEHAQREEAKKRTEAKERG